MIVVKPKHPILIALGKELKALREAAGLSQRELAKLFGYTTAQFVSNWERGLIAPPLKVLKQLEKIFKTKKKVFEAYEKFILSGLVMVEKDWTK